MAGAGELDDVGRQSMRWRVVVRFFAERESWREFQPLYRWVAKIRGLKT